jgi:peptidoglycan/xylan/chitin deacetylase (PgdA/CDA1 family)
MIYATHGTVVGWQPHLFIHRNMLDETAYVRWLRAREEPCMSLGDALEGRADALTIDDGTFAAARAANLAVSFGHKVTLFVNPYHVASEEQYFFALLNTALDACRLGKLRWRGQLYRLGSQSGKRDVRAIVKSELRGLSSEALRKALVQEFLDCAQATDLQPPHDLRPLSVRDLIQLRDAGVDIANHGWTHGEIGTLDSRAASEEIESAGQWLAQSLTVESHYFAVPFGDTLPPIGLAGTWKVWFLLTDRLPAGWISDRVYNRQTLTI